MDEQSSFQPLDAGVTDDHALDNEQLYITDEICAYWRETSQWTYGLAIGGFIALGALLLVGIFLFNMVTVPASFLLILGIIGLVPAMLSYNLMRHSTSIRKAADDSDWEALETGFSCLRNAYIIYGVFAVILVLLCIVLIAQVVKGVALSFL